MSYIINGPTQIGDTGQLNEILGTLQLSDVCTATGDIIYSSNAAGLMVALPIGTAGQVLTVAGGVPTWVTATTTETGFAAIKSGTQGPIAAPFADTVITTWSVAAPYYDTTGGDFAPLTGIYTASTAGSVNVRAGVSLLSTNNGGSRSLSIRYNALTNVYTATAQPSANNTIPLSLTVSAGLILSATDTVTVAVTSTAAAGSSTVQDAPGTWFSVTKNYTP